jgi:hypothetical protein
MLNAAVTVVGLCGSAAAAEETVNDMRRKNRQEQS